MVQLLKVLLLLSVVALSVNSLDQKTIIYPLGELGNAKGLIGKSSWTRQTFYSFRDLRYAEPPVGRRRFKPTRIINKFDEDPYDATRFRRGCISLNFIIPKNSSDEEILDCLYLTIHTPNLLINQSVMVYITGFDLLQGSNREVDPKYFMEKNIVLVSIQYRMGVFGFLNAGTSNIPGNTGIKDIVTALKWIRKHIYWFGGDSKSVTLFGQYKAAGLIQMLTMIPEAEGLFQKAICQSGSVFTQNLLSMSTASLSLEFGITLGCPNIMNRKKLAECLLGVDLNDLNGIFRKHVQNMNGNVGLLTIGDSIGLIQYSPYDLQNQGIIRPYPMIFGIVEHPSTYLLDAYFNETLSIFTSNRTNLIDGLGLSKSGYEKFRLDGISDQDKKMRKNLKSGIVLNSGPTYVYIFKYKGEYHFFERKSGNPLQDIALLDDNIYMFPYPESVSNLDSEMDTKIAKIVTNLWTNFAKNSVPRINEVKEWPVFNLNTTKYLVIDSILSIDDDFENYTAPIISES